MCDFQDNLRSHHSLYGAETRHNPISSEATWKSDMNVTSSANTAKRTRQGSALKEQLLKHGNSAEYYKRYEHDEIPVKDETKSNKTIKIETKYSDKHSLTNSELERLEDKIYKNISQELQTDYSSVSILESNIKFFRTTVQEIFDNFYSSMKDFELYKKRYEEIIAKNPVDSIADMEDFIIDMLQHIKSSDSNLSHESRNWAETAESEAKDKDLGNPCDASEKDTEDPAESVNSIVEAYRSENYLTSSTCDDKSSKAENYTKKEETFNIYLMGGASCVQIKMNDSNLLSGRSLKEENYVASAEDLKKLAAKKHELETYVRQQQENHAPDIDIPVKVSFAKKNIHLNEDFAHERDKDESRSFISKICGYICKKLRKT